MEELDHLDDGRSERATDEGNGAELMKDSLFALEIGIIFFPFSTAELGGLCNFIAHE